MKYPQVGSVRLSVGASADLTIVGPVAYPVGSRRLGDCTVAGQRTHHSRRAHNAMARRSLLNRAMRRLSRSRTLKPGTEPLRIPQLISPLRYDVVVRAHFLADLRSRNFDRPSTALYDFADGHEYFDWFQYVESARFFPELLDDAPRLRTRYHQRVARALATLQSYDRSGFDARYPVTLAHTSRGVLTDKGARITKQLHIGDGCHRLALLLLDDKPLLPAMYRVQRVSGPLPDNTYIMIRHLRIPDEEYVSFLSESFDVPGQIGLPQLRSTLAERTPERLTELDGLLLTHHSARQRAD